MPEPEHFETANSSREVRVFIGQSVLHNHLRGVLIRASTAKAAILAEIDHQGDSGCVRVYHGLWSDLDDDGHIVWRGLANVAVPLEDDAEPRIVVVADDYSRMKMDYEMVVQEMAAA